MPGPLTITDGQLATKDSSEALVYQWDYDADNLATGVQLTSAGTFTITPSAGLTLTQDNQALVTGNRKVRVRLSAGTVGKKYRIEHTVTTNETPSQTKSKFIWLVIT